MGNSTDISVSKITFRQNNTSSCGITILMNSSKNITIRVVTKLLIDKIFPSFHNFSWTCSKVCVKLIISNNLDISKNYVWCDVSERRTKFPISNKQHEKNM